MLPAGIESIPAILMEEKALGSGRFLLKNGLFEGT
jgi:hypothetical protein